MWGRRSIYRYVGSVISDHGGTKGTTHVPPTDNSNETTAVAAPADPKTKDDSFTETYMMIVIFLSTLIPLMCVILSAALARKIWVKFHDQPSTAVDREDTTQTSIKSGRDLAGSRKSSRGGSRVSKSDPNSRDQLLPQLLEEELERRPSILSSRRRSSSYFVFQDMDEEPSYENRSYVNSPIMPQEGTIDTPLEDPIIIVDSEDDAVASTSQERMENATTIINIEDDGGFGGARSKFRNHSLKVDVEGSPLRTSHHRSYSDAGRNRKKGETEASKEAEKSSSRSGNLLSAPGTKIRKSEFKQPFNSHSMRYRTDGSPTGTRPRSQAQDDCIGNLKRGTLDPEIMVTSPRLSQRRSPHHFYQQQHHPQVHHQPHSSHHQQHFKTHHRQEEQDAQMTQLIDDGSVPSDQTVEQELDSANFGLSTSDLSLDENGTANPSYKYGNQPPNKYPPLNKVMYYGGYYGYPATSTGYTSTDMRPRHLHVSSRQGSGASPTEGDENKEQSDRKKSLPNAFDFPPPENRPMPVLSPRGLLSKQFSLPAGARNQRQLKAGGHQRHHASLRHDPAPQRLLEAPGAALTRRASARERTSSGGSAGFLSRRTASGGRTSGSFNLGSVSPRSPIPPTLGGSVSPRNHFSISRPGQSPSPHHVQEDEIQHI